MMSLVDNVDCICIYFPAEIGEGVRVHVAVFGGCYGGGGGAR